MPELSPTARAVLDELEWRRDTHPSPPSATIDYLTEVAVPITRVRRDVESAIQELRLAGYPVISSGHGVRLTDDPSEVEACARALRSRLVSQAKTTRALQRTARKMRQPAVLFPELTA